MCPAKSSLSDSAMSILAHVTNKKQFWGNFNTLRGLLSNCEVRNIFFVQIHTQFKVSLQIPQSVNQVQLVFNQFVAAGVAFGQIGLNMAIFGPKMAIGGPYGQKVAHSRLNIAPLNISNKFC